MRSFQIFLTVVLVGLVSMCKDPEPNVCTEAEEIVNATMEMVCDGRVDCLPCDCWSVGQTVDGTECSAAPECDEAEAAVCVADTIECASVIIVAVESICGTDL